MDSLPMARLTVIMLGVSDMNRSIAFYAGLGFKRKMSVTGEEVAFFETGGAVLGLFPWVALAEDAAIKAEPRPQTFRGSTLAWNCSDREEVDATLVFATANGAKLLKAAHDTSYGGYSGYFSDLDDHPWEVVVAPGFEVMSDGRVRLPD